jgi:steroid 5-alpha reductase family enzyme
MKRTSLFFSACAVAAALAYASRAEPFVVVCYASAGFAFCAFFFGLATKDYSWVDRLWSVAPLSFAWFYALRAGGQAASMAGALLVTAWGIRLSLNFARRGGYSGSEDYRWSVLRERIPSPVLWQLFNAAFICCFQVALLALFSSPLSLLASRGGLQRIAFPAALAVAFLAWETEADRQQWRFQARKHARPEAPGSPGGNSEKVVDLEAERGFCSSGLFRLSRHPAYFGELGFWWSVYLFGALGSGRLLNPSIAGAVVLTDLFIVSTIYTEAISASKYPAYREYQAATSAIVPWFPRTAAKEGATEGR